MVAVSGVCAKECSLRCSVRCELGGGIDGGGKVMFDAWTGCMGVWGTGKEEEALAPPAEAWPRGTLPSRWLSVCAALAEGAGWVLPSARAKDACGSGSGECM